MAGSDSAAGKLRPFRRYFLFAAPPFSSPVFVIGPFCEPIVEVMVPVCGWVVLVLESQEFFSRFFSAPVRFVKLLFLGFVRGASLTDTVPQDFESVLNKTHERLRAHLFKLIFVHKSVQKVMITRELFDYSRAKRRECCQPQAAWTGERCDAGWHGCAVRKDALTETVK